MKNHFAALATLALVACNQAAPVPEASATAEPGLATPTPVATGDTAPSPTPSPASSDGTPAPANSGTLASTAGKAPPGSRDPQVVLAWWRNALETHDYATARRVWGQNGTSSGQTPQAFAAAWDKYRIIDITTGKGDQEGAAGSSYYEVPVTVTGLRRDGKPYNLAGKVTLRRVNDIEGATPEQLRWHIESSTLKP